GDERGLDPDAHRARLRPLRLNRHRPAGVSRALVLQAPAPVERRLILAGTYEADLGRSGVMCFASRITRADESGRKSHPCPWTEVLPISPTVRIWVVLTTSAVTRARSRASARSEEHTELQSRVDLV